MGISRCEMRPVTLSSAANTAIGFWILSACASAAPSVASAAIRLNRKAGRARRDPALDCCIMPRTLWTGVRRSAPARSLQAMASAMNLAWMWRGQLTPCLTRSVPRKSPAGCDPRSTRRRHHNRAGRNRSRTSAKIFDSSGSSKLLEERPTEGFEPSLNADLERSRARHEDDGFGDEAALLKQPPIFGDRGKEPGGDPSQIAAMQRTDGPQCRCDGRRVAVAAELADKAVIGLSARATPAITSLAWRIR
jgi:hypothetical protein